MGQSHRRVQGSLRPESHLHRESSRKGQVKILCSFTDQTHRSDTCDLDAHSLIGEHIDYALFGVFPAAVERDILIALASRPQNGEPGVVAANTEPKYAEQTFTPSRVTSNADTPDQDPWLIDINTKELRWDSYVKAGYYVRSRNRFSPDGVSHVYPNLVSGCLEQLLWRGDG